MKYLLPESCIVSCVKYFTALSRHSNQRKERQKKYWAALKYEGTEVIEGKYSVYDGKLTEKQTDVNLATHMVYDCSRNPEVECVALVSNDSDYKLPLEFAKQKLKKKVFLYSPKKGEILKELKRNSTKCMRIDPRVLDNCRLPPVVREDSPRIVIPDKWKDCSPL